MALVCSKPTDFLQSGDKAVVGPKIGRTVLAHKRGRHALLTNALGIPVVLHAGPAFGVGAAERWRRNAICGGRTRERPRATGVARRGAKQRLRVPWCALGLRHRRVPPLRGRARLQQLPAGWLANGQNHHETRGPHHRAPAMWRRTRQNLRRRRWQMHRSSCFPAASLARALRPVLMRGRQREGRRRQMDHEETPDRAALASWSWCAQNVQARPTTVTLAPLAGPRNSRPNGVRAGVIRPTQASPKGVPRGPRPPVTSSSRVERSTVAISPAACWRRGNGRAAETFTHRRSVAPEGCTEKRLAERALFSAAPGSKCSPPKTNTSLVSVIAVALRPHSAPGLAVTSPTTSWSAEEEALAFVDWEQAILFLRRHACCLSQQQAACSSDPKGEVRRTSAALRGQWQCGRSAAKGVSHLPVTPQPASSPAPSTPTSRRRPRGQQVHRNFVQRGALCWQAPH